jgi:hypothetical protein
MQLSAGLHGFGRPMHEIQEGNRVTVISGPFKGREGRIVLTWNGNHRLVARLLRLTPGWTRVALDGFIGDVTVHESELGPAGSNTAGATRLENDDELRARVCAALAQVHGEALDVHARLLNMERVRLPT